MDSTEVPGLDRRVAVIVSNEWLWFLFAVTMEVILLVTIGGGTVLAYHVEQKQSADSQPTAHPPSAPDQAIRSDAPGTTNDNAATRRDTGVSHLGRKPSAPARTRDGYHKASPEVPSQPSRPPRERVEARVA
jgi:hypothetical protein